MIFCSLPPEIQLDFYYKYFHLETLRGLSCASTQYKDELQVIFNSSREANILCADSIKNLDKLLDYTKLNGISVKWLNFQIIPSIRRKKSSDPITEQEKIVAIIENCPNLASLSLYPGSNPLRDLSNENIHEIDNDYQETEEESGCLKLLNAINTNNLPMLEKLSMHLPNPLSLGTLKKSEPSFNFLQMQRLNSICLYGFDLNAADLEQIGQLTSCEHLELGFECRSLIQKPILAALKEIKSIKSLKWNMTNHNLSFPSTNLKVIRDLPCTQTADLNFVIYQKLCDEQLLLLNIFKHVTLSVFPRPPKDLKDRINRILPDLSVEMIEIRLVNGITGEPIED